MSWVDAIKARVTGAERKDVPDNLWTKCDACSRVIFSKELAANLSVCPHCGHHGRIDARTRVSQLSDPESWEEIALPETRDDPLNFNDQKPYKTRLADDRRRTGKRDAFVAGRCTIDGVPVVLGALDFTFRGGSMSSGMGEGIVAAVEQAVARKVPLILVTASGGARMQEGILSLMQMPRTLFALSDLKAERLPYIVLLADPTTGGVTASFAMTGDVHIAEPNAVIGFAGQRVIEETIRRTLPPGFQRSQSLMDHGMVDMVVERKNLRAELAKVLRMLTGR